MMPDVSELLTVALLLAALLVWVALAGAEATLAAAREVAHEDRDAGRVGLFYELHRHPRRLLISLALGRELALVTVAAVAALLGYGRGGLQGGLAALVAAVLLILVLRGAAAGHAARRLARGDASIGRAFGWLLAPLAGLARVEKRIGRRVAHALLGAAPTGYNIFAAEELAALSPDREGGEQLAAAERTLVAKAISFGDRPVRHVLTPRRDMVAVPVDVAPAELLRVIRASGCSRIPVYRGEKDDVIGILYVKDLIGKTLVQGGVAPLLREPYVVPAEKSVGELLREFRARKVHIALVLDEYGSLVGLVTMEDLLEELFGEIRDEFDEAAGPAIRRRGARTYVVSGRTSLDALNDRLHLNIPQSGDEATIAGVVIDRLGRVPDAGESVELEGFTVTVEKLDGPAIELLRVDLWSSSSLP